MALPEGPDRNKLFFLIGSPKVICQTTKQRGITSGPAGASLDEPSRSTSRFVFFLAAHIALIGAGQGVNTKTPKSGIPVVCSARPRNLNHGDLDSQLHCQVPRFKEAAERYGTRVDGRSPVPQLRRHVCHRISNSLQSSLSLRMNGPAQDQGSCWTISTANHSELRGR